MKYRPGGRACEPGSSLEGAPGEDRPVGGAMAESEALPHSGEQHAVLADDVPSADHRKANLAALAGAAAPSAAAGLLARRAWSRGPRARRLPQGQGRSRGRVLLHPVMGFDDLDIELQPAAPRPPGEPAR